VNIESVEAVQFFLTSTLKLAHTGSVQRLILTQAIVCVAVAVNLQISQVVQVQSTLAKKVGLLHHHQAHISVDKSSKRILLIPEIVSTAKKSESAREVIPVAAEKAFS
jgi:hypothetical protein